MGERAFGDSSLKSVTTPANLKVLPKGAFQYCNNLETISIEGVTEIGEDAFQWCQKLKKVYIPLSVIKIGKAAFFDCSELAEVSISSNVKNIENFAFSNCYKLREVTCYGTNPPTLGTNEPFTPTYASSNKLYVPKGYVNAYKNKGYSTYFGKFIEL